MVLLVPRRRLLGAVALASPGLSSAQAGARPSVTVAVQQIAWTNTLDIAREASNVGMRHFALYTEPMIATDWTGDLSLRPGLATGWTVRDERVVEVELRPGVRFHDGREMTAEDVAFSFGPRLYGAEGPRAAPREVVANSRSAFPHLAGVEVLGRHRLRFTNGRPDVTLVQRLSLRIGVVVSQHAFEAAPDWLAYARRPVGTGPYRVVDYRPEQHLMLEAHDEYWGGPPPLRRIRFIEVPQLAARLAMLRSGEVEFATDITPDTIREIEADPRLEVSGGLISNLRMVNFDKNHPVLADPRVRRAMGLAIDRRLLVGQLWSGRTEVGRGLQFPFYGEMFIGERPEPPHDRAEARRLLREAGYRGEPIPYRLIPNYYTMQAANAQVMAEMWREVGLNIRMQVQENWGQVMDPSTPRGVDDNSHTAHFADPVSAIPVLIGPNGGLTRRGYWSNAEALGLVETLEGSTDRARRRAAFTRLLEILEWEDPAISTLHRTANFTAKRREIAWKPSGSFVMDLGPGNVSFRRV